MADEPLRVHLQLHPLLYMDDEDTVRRWAVRERRARVSLGTEMSLHHCRTSKRADPSVLQWVCTERQISATPLAASFQAVKQGNGSGAAQRCVAQPKVGVSKSQIICF